MASLSDILMKLKTEIIVSIVVSIFVVSVMNNAQPFMVSLILSTMFGYHLYNITKIHWFAIPLLSLCTYAIYMFIDFNLNYKFSKQDLINNLWKIPFSGLISLLTIDLL
jgi:hypothetical protein